MNLDLTVAKQRYIRQKGAVGRLGSIAAELRLLTPGHDTVAVVGGKTALELTLGAMTESLASVFVSSPDLEAIWYGGECSPENISRVADSLRRLHANLVVGVGGGKALDTAKAAARRAGIPVVTVPTIAATCAAFTPLSVLYNDGGDYLRMEYDVETPAAVVVDTDVVAAAPDSYFRSGIGDTLAKKFEISAATERFFTARSGSAAGSAVAAVAPAALGLATAARTFADRAFSLIAAAVQGEGQRDGDGEMDAVDSAIDAIVLLGGLASSFAGHGARTACAHAVHDALTLLPESRRFLHGELVAVGTVCQAVIEGRPAEELSALLNLLRRADLPCAPNDIGLDVGGKDGRRVAEAAASSEDMGNMPRPVSADDVLYALHRANELAAVLAPAGADVAAAIPSSPLELAQPAAKRAEPFVPSVYDEEAPDIARQLGLASVIKLSFNENTIGPSPKAVAAMHEAVDSAAFYPDHTGRRLRTALAGRVGLTPESVVLANGADEAIGIICQTFIRPEVDEVLISAPTFGSYRSSAIVSGAIVREVPLSGFRHDVDALIGALTPRTKLLFVCNPNNPTGRYATRDEIDRLVRALPPQTILVLDEAYIEYVTAPDFPDALAYLRGEADAGRPNVIVIRTFSKIHGLAGLRLGYALARPELARFLQAVRLPVNINRVALAGALASLSDQEHLRRVRDLVTAEKERLYRELSARGLVFQPSEANFILVDVGADAEAACQEALCRGVVLRPGNGFGLTHHVRFTVGTPAENDAALRALDDALPDDGLAPKNSTPKHDQGVA